MEYNYKNLKVSKIHNILNAIKVKNIRVKLYRRFAIIF